MQIKISVIISTYNEMGLSFLETSLKTLTQFKDLEVIAVDKNSDDGTTDLLRRYNAKVISTDLNSRAQRLNLGISNASAKNILLYHPRSILDAQGIHSLIDNIDNYTWGAFTHCFDKKHPVLTFTSWYSNMVRGDIFNIYYLDHCIFINLNVVADFKVPEVDIFEDTEICKLLRSKGRGVRLSNTSTTSAIRFTRNGIFRQAALNQVMKLCYFFKVSDKQMNKIYEYGLNLNSKY